MVADLSAHLGVEDGIVENDALSSTDIENRFDIGAGMVVFVAEKIGRRLCRPSSATSITLFFCALRAAVALFLHQLLEAFRVDREPAFPRHQFGQIERKPVGVVELESCLRYSFSPRILIKELRIVLLTSISSEVSLIDA